MVRKQAQIVDVPPSPLWFKVTGMLEQNWAMVVEPNKSKASEQAPATILFFDDQGAVFDELTYSTAAKADHALEFNGFTPLNDQQGFRAIAGLPKSPLTRSEYDHRPVYSSGEYWRQPPGIERVTHRRVMAPYGLERFVQAQGPVIDTAMEELRAGHKQTHWMWFVFPQMYGLGHSKNAQKFGIVNLEEAQAYLQHPLLGSRLNECFQHVLKHRERSATEIFGRIDAMKFCSCATLFREASFARHSVFELALSVFFGGNPDPETLRLL